MVFLEYFAFLEYFGNLKYYWQYFLFDWSGVKGRSNNRVSHYPVNCWSGIVNSRILDPLPF